MSTVALRRVGLLIVALLFGVMAKAEPRPGGPAALLVKDPGLLYFAIRPDFRRCAAPLCGGYFVQAVNRSRLRCADGELRKECYVADIRWKDLGLTDEGRVTLVRGKRRKLKFPGIGVLDELLPREAWRRAGAPETGLVNPPTPKGRWFGVRSNGIVCITEPCFDLDAQVLNRKSRHTISRLDLDAADASPEDEAEALRLLESGQRLIAVGQKKVEREAGPAGDDITLFATAFFLPVRPKVPPELYCEVDDDCTTSVFVSPVRSPDECYCPLCPQPLNVEAARENALGWRENCRGFGFPVLGARGVPVCPQVLCVAPRRVRCLSNKCSFVDDVLWPLR